MVSLLTTPLLAMPKIMKTKGSDISENKCINLHASKHLAIPTPVSWVLFRKVLQKVAKGSPIVSYKQVVAVGEACGIAEDVVPSVLHFYHELAVFLHYTQIESLSDKVMVDPQWFIKQLGKLLVPEGLEQKVSNQLLWKPCMRKASLFNFCMRKFGKKVS